MLLIAQRSAQLRRVTSHYSRKRILPFRALMTDKVHRNTARGCARSVGENDGRKPKENENKIKRD